MHVRSFQALAFDHQEYVVAAHLSASLMDQETVAAIVANYRIKRKSIDSILSMQLIGNQFRVGRRGKVNLLCHVLDYVPGQIDPGTLQDLVEKIVKQTNAKTAIVSEGFLTRRKGRVDPRYSFDLLCQYLVRAEFSGVVYEPPGLVVSDKDSVPEERVTNTRMMLQLGKVDPTVTPIFQKLASDHAK